MITNLLANVSWKKKIFAFAGLFLFGIIVEAALGGYTILKQNSAMRQALEGSRAKVDAAITARAAILEMSRSQADLISQSNPQAIRTAAIAAIRASSVLDEAVQQLAQTLANNATVMELGRLIVEIKPARLDVIRAARGNDDTKALSIEAGMQEAVRRIEDLSRGLVDEEQSAQKEVMDDQDRQATKTIILLGTFVGVGLLIGIGVSFVGAHLMTRPLAILDKSMAALATGDLSIHLEKSGTDEIGRTINSMSQTVRDLHALVGKVYDGAGKLSQEADEVSRTADRIKGGSDGLHGSVKEIKQDAEVVLTAATEALAQLSSLTDAAESTAGISERMNKEIEGTVSSFNQFQQHMESTAKVTRDLSRTAETITSITNTIRDISSQTNLLALNAAIEAARAGEQGRGFAVVADEVRGLARRTDDATGEISALVENIAANIGQTVTLLEEVTEQANTNVERLKAVANDTTDTNSQVIFMKDAISGIELLMNDQERAIAGINSAVGDLLSLSTDTNRQTELLDQLAGKLNREAGELNLVVDKFTL